MTWLRVRCVSPFCGHSRALPLAPWRIRWGVDNPSQFMRQNFYCGSCGRKGCEFEAPQHGTGQNGFQPDYAQSYPHGAEQRINGERKPGETWPDAAIRNRIEYLARYPGGDALLLVWRGPTGPGSMCGKFTAMASWSEVVAFSTPLTREDVQPTDNDREITFRVMSVLPVIVWDPVEKVRRVVPMRWGFPDPQNWKQPRPIHARAESIDTTKAFASAFLDGERGIVLVRTFNEAPDLSGPVAQHVITPGDQGAIGIAFVWRKFDLSELPGSMTACVMVTVPANSLIATLPTDRMPAVLAEKDWPTWLGEVGSAADAKACLKTVEGVQWTMTKEERSASKKPRSKPTVSDPGGLL